MRPRPKRAVVALLALVLLALLSGGVALLLARGEPATAERQGAAEGEDASGAGGDLSDPGGERAPISIASAALAQRDRAAKTGTLEGRVLDFATGEPVADAELTFSRGLSASSTMSNIEGEFLFRASEPDTYELATVSADGYLPFAPEWGHSPIRFTARPGVRIRGVTVHLRPAVEYLGRVEDPTGRPVPGAELLVLGTPSGTTALVPLEDRFVTDGSGEVRFTAPDGALVEARAEPYGPGRARIDDRTQITRRLVVRLRAGASAGGGSLETIAGIVVDPDGSPVGGALVAARAAFRARSDLGTTDQTATDDAGRFVLTGLDAGRYVVTATRGGRAPARAVGVPSGVSDLVLRLTDGGSLSGTVTDRATGDPVPSFGVVVQRRYGPLGRAPYRTETVFDADGRYEVAGLEPGTYSVLVTAHGYAPSTETEVTLRGDASERARADFLLVRGGAVTGVVTEAGSGEPVGGARVSLEARAGDDDSPVPLTASTVTDSAGHFEIRGLAAGLRSIVVTATGHHRRIVSGLRVSDGGGVGPVGIELTRLAADEEPTVELTGIGAVLSIFREGLMVVQVVEGGGAAEAGLGRGDAILAVDGQPVLELGFEGSIERIRGVENTAVRLTVRRRGAEPEDLVVVRRRIRAS